MIKFLSERTARYLASDDENADIEVLAYGYYVIYQQWVVSLVLLLMAIPFGLFFHVLASLATSMTLRAHACGAHANHALVCKIAAFALAFIPSIISVVFAVSLMPVVVVLLYLFAVALLAKYAPGDTNITKVRDPALRKRMKLKAIVWLTIFFFVAAVFLQARYPAIAFVVMTTAVLTSCFVHPWVYWLFGFDPVTKEARKQRA